MAAEAPKVQQDMQYQADHNQRDQNGISHLDGPDKGRGFEARRIMRKPRIRERRRDAGMAFLAGFHDFLAGHFGISVFETLDIVNTVAVIAGGDRLFRPSGTERVQPIGSTVKVVQVSDQDVGIQSVLLHSFFIAVAFRAELVGIQSELGSAWARNRMGPVAIRAGGGVGVVLEERLAVYRKFELVRDAAVARRAFFVD